MAYIHNPTKAQIFDSAWRCALARTILYVPDLIRYLQRARWSARCMRRIPLRRRRRAIAFFAGTADWLISHGETYSLEQLRADRDSGTA